MGQDPKPTKRHRQAAAALHRLPATPPSPLPPSGSKPELHRNAVSARPSSVSAHEPGGDTPGLLELLECGAGIEDAGYFKLCPGNSGKSWYLSYRWKWGLWAGHYVMAVVDRGDLRYGLVLLLEKINNVARGVLRPTPDKFGD